MGRSRADYGLPATNLVRVDAARFGAATLLNRGGADRQRTPTTGMEPSLLIATLNTFLGGAGRGSSGARVGSGAPPTPPAFSRWLDKAAPAPRRDARRVSGSGAHRAPATLR